MHTGNVLVQTAAFPWQKARSVSQTSTTFASRIATITEPTGDAASATGACILEPGLGTGSIVAQNNLLLVPYGAGSDDTTFSLRVIGWRAIGPVSGVTLWVPVNLVELACTLGAAVGIAGAPLTTTDRFADIITLTTGSTAGSVSSENIVSPANDTIAHAMIDLKGFRKFEITFSTGSSATNCNALWTLL